MRPFRQSVALGVLDLGPPPDPVVELRVEVDKLVDKHVERLGERLERLERNLAGQVSYLEDLIAAEAATRSVVDEELRRLIVAGPAQHVREYTEVELLMLEVVRWARRVCQERVVHPELAEALERLVVVQ